MAKGASAVWNIRPTAGSDTNGGAFDSTIAGSGTDYSQQNGAQLTVTDLVGTSTTTLTSVTGGFTSAMVGNALFQNGDSDRYFITARTNTNTITVDRATGTFTGKTCNVGGALASQAEAYSTRGGVGGNTFNVMNTGTESTGSTLTPPSGASATAPTIIKGHNTVLGDLDADTALYANFPIVQASAGATFCYTLSGGDTIVRNLLVDANLLATRCFSATGGATTIEHCVVKNFTDYGIWFGSNNILVLRTWATGGKSGCTGGFGIGSNSCRVDYCAATANNGPGFEGEASGFHALRCISAGNLGAAGHGIKLYSGAAAVYIVNCDLYNNAGDGITITTATTQFQAFELYSSAITGNSGYGVNSPALPAYAAADYNAFFGNSLGARNNFPTGTHDVTLTASPYVNPGITITRLSDFWTGFALNSTAGGGAACQGAGFP